MLLSYSRRNQESRVHVKFRLQSIHLVRVEKTCLRNLNSRSRSSHIAGDNASIMSIFVGNLPYEVSEDDIKKVFAEYGSVSRIHLPTDQETGRIRGFAFVEMGTETEEDSAIAELNGAEWMGRTMRVDKARPRENRQKRGNFNRF